MRFGGFFKYLFFGMKNLGFMPVVLGHESDKKIAPWAARFCMRAFWII